MENWDGITTLFMRIVIAGIFLWHGIPKALDWGMASQKFIGMGFPGFLGGIVGVVEVIAAILILIGVYHKWAYFALAVIILVAVVFVQIPGGITAALERDLMIFAGTLLLAKKGPGAFALSK